MNFGELQQELMDRGFSYLNDSANGQARAKRWINRAYAELVEEADWEFAKGLASGPPPLTVSDMRDVLSVTGPNGALEESTIASLDDDFDLTTTGTAAWWYRDGTQIKVYPVDTQDVTVRYLKTPADMVASGDVPIVPPRYHELIVDLAVIRALKDRSNFQETTALRQMLDTTDLPAMRAALLGQDPMFQRLTDPQAA